jgi:phosphoribosylanthranilate isomerase
MAKPKQYIGVTGITTIEDVENMTNALDGHFGMYGILMDYRTQIGEIHKNRYANVKDVADLMKKMPEDSLRTIHWCGKELNLNLLERALETGEGLCNAVQLNMPYPPLERLKEFKDNHSHKIIFEIERCMFEEPKEMARKIVPYVPFIDYAIIDQSMGEGRPIDPAVSRAVANEIENLGLGIVVAGGLNAQRVLDPEIADLIIEYHTSTDAEGNLMNKNDHLDSSKVTEYVKAVKAVHDKNG